MFIYRFMEIRLSEPMIYDNTSEFVNRYQRPGLNIAARPILRNNANNKQQTNTKQ